VQNSWFHRTALLKGAAQKSSAREYGAGPSDQLFWKELFKKVQFANGSCSIRSALLKRAVQKGSAQVKELFKTISS
jgi:hypothetical protein